MNKKQALNKQKRTFLFTFAFLFLGVFAILFYILKDDDWKQYLPSLNNRYIPCCQQELGDKLLVMQKDGKTFSLGISGNKIAYEEDEKENHLYGNMRWFDLENFIALMYKDYTCTKSENPYFDSVFNFDTIKYYNNEIVYTSVTEQINVIKYFNNEGQQIYAYQPDKEGQAFIKKLYPKFKGSRRRIGSPKKDDYIDITAFLQTKFNKKLSYTIDENKKLLIIHF